MEVGKNDEEMARLNEMSPDIRAMRMGSYMSEKEQMTTTCEFCKKRIEVRKGNFVHVYIEPPLIHAYHLDCYKTLVINEFLKLSSLLEQWQMSIKQLLEQSNVYSKINGGDNEQNK